MFEKNCYKLVVYWHFVVSCVASKSRYLYTC